MRHRKSGRKFGRESDHRKAMMRNLVTSLIKHGRIETTVAKAKEVRGLAEKTINWGVKVAEQSKKEGKDLTKDDRAKVVHARRMAGKIITEKETMERLFREVAPEFVGRPGGFTRVLKTRIRRGDAAPMAFVELVG